MSIAETHAAAFISVAYWRGIFEAQVGRQLTEPEIAKVEKSAHDNLDAWTYQARELVRLIHNQPRP